MNDIDVAVTAFLPVVFRTILKESGYPRYLHSAVLLGGTLLIFGGNTHNDTSLSNGAKCFSADFLAYDIGMNCLFLSSFLRFVLFSKLSRQVVSSVVLVSVSVYFGFCPN